MEKLVNVYTRYVVRGLKGVPIRSTVRAIKLDTDDIRTCILAKAVVEEVLDDGSTLPLNFVNYNKDNNAQFRQPAPAPKPEKKAEPKPAPVVEAPVAEPVVEETAEVVEETAADEATEEATAEETTDEATEDKPATPRRRRNR